ERFGKHTDHRLLHTALYFGIPAALGGVIFLLTDLSYPLRFWHLFVFINFTSPMSIGSWLLILWTAIGVLIVFLWHTRNRIPIKPVILNRIMNYLHWAGFFASLILMSYTGVLLAASNQPLWSSTVLLPPLFVVSAISTGAAILILLSVVTGIWKIYGETIQRMVQVDVIVIVVELVILFAYLFLLSRSGIPGANESMSQLTTGELAVPFWFGVVLLAILLPFALNVFNWGKKVGERKIVFVSLIASSVCVIFGGLILRTVIVIGGQI
ncbi:MAG: polysulfide reductase NrfD, partial [Actinobacteria bacterium]|nr:polysulfide reductase NrfD [Actinomycetota bacterium]